jgi:hypothetical protein
VRESLLVESEPQLERAGLASASFAGDALRRILSDTADLVRYAREAAGSTFGPAAIYVDGQPSTVLPPATAIESLTVNQDPQSVERADGNRTQVDIRPRPGTSRPLRPRNTVSSRSREQPPGRGRTRSRGVMGFLSGPPPARMTFSPFFTLNRRVERVPSGRHLDGVLRTDGRPSDGARAGTLAVSVHHRSHERWTSCGVPRAIADEQRRSEG